MNIVSLIDDITLQKMLMSRAERLRHYVASKVPPKLKSLLSPEDILQDVWISAFRTVSGFREDGPDAFDRWLTTIANRKLVDSLRTGLAVKRGGRTPVLGQTRDRRSSFVDLFARVASPQSTPSRVTSAKEAATAVQIALAGLSEARRHAIRMRHIEGKTVSQIAKTMQRTVPAVNSLIFHGLKELRTRLGSAEKFFSDAAPPV